MKTSIIEVGLPTDKVSTVLPALQQCLLETGDVLIGHQVYDDLTLFVVRLLGNTLQSHLKTLSSAYDGQLIDSFQIIACHMFKVVFTDDGHQDALRDFPLHAGESWFRAADTDEAAYLCLNSSYLNQEQIAWLAAQTSITQWTKEP
jgi:hypothetical protein